MSFDAPNLPARYCANCGAAAPAYDLNCARCGRALASALPAAGAAVSDEGRRSGMPGWALGLIACVVVSPFLIVVLGIVAAIAIPGFQSGQARTKARSAGANLSALWDAEKAWADTHEGEYLEFVIEKDDLSDPGFKKLGVKLPKIQHTYEAFFDGDHLWLTATGNIDADAFPDEWELISIDGIPDHYSDDVGDLSHDPKADGYFEEEEEEEYAGDDDDEEEEGGAIGGVMGGLALSGTISETHRKSQTARTNLEAIWEKQVSYRKAKKSYLTFTDGSASTWASLGVVLPEAVNHKYAAKMKGAELFLSATANLDEDPFEDEWAVNTGTGTAYQLRNDANDRVLVPLLDD